MYVFCGMYALSLLECLDHMLNIVYWVDIQVLILLI
jgi:hypothetical protein